MIMTLHQCYTILVLALLFQTNYAIRNTAGRCQTGCIQKVDEGFQKGFCAEVCKRFLNYTSQDDQLLLRPGVPTLVNSEFRSIRLSWNTTNFNLTALTYILEVRPNWTYNGENVYHPYVPKYHHSNVSILTVENLVAKTRYQFRVLAVSHNKLSSFSNWSELIETNYSCSGNSCSVTNMRLEVTVMKHDRRMAEFVSGIFRWEPNKDISLSENLAMEIDLCDRAIKGHCHDKLFSETSKDIKKENLSNRNLSFVDIFENTYDQFYFGCCYKLEIYQSKPRKFVLNRWEFHIPECVTSPNVCGCLKPSTRIENQHFGKIYFKRMISNANKSSVYISWTDDTWRNDINVTYYQMRIKFDGPTKITFFDVINNTRSKYNVTYYNLTNDKEYTLEIYAYHRDHCPHGVYEIREFIVSYPCDPDPCLATPNSTCKQPDKLVNSYTCECLTGLEKIGNFCKDIYPCSKNPCLQNETCSVDNATAGDYYCLCKGGFVKNENGTCIAKCDFDPKAPDCVKPTIPVQSSWTSGRLAAAIATPLIVVIVIGALVVLCQRHFQRKRLRTLHSVMDSVYYNNNPQTFTLTNPYGYQPASVNLPKCSKTDAEDDRELNVLYVPQEITEAIARGLTDGVLEFASDRLKLGGIIDRGAFGEVHVAEAHGIKDNPGWVKVAVKKLADKATEEEVQEFMGEIELMKKLGEHTNVIQMYGCCTVTPPLCLIMEFASGGSLIKYLVSLKLKCMEVSKLNDGSNQNDLPEEEKFQKFFEPGELAEELEACSFSSGKTPLDSSENMPDNTVANIEEKNRRTAAIINNRMRKAINPKELESFACQIANGMTHVASLGIIHRDLAARNILMDKNHILKISDFGLSREEEFYVKRTSGKIPLRWLSVEAIQQRKYSTASDVWAFGIILWEICTLGNVPYPSVSDNDLLKFLMDGHRMSKPASCTNDIYEIMLKCWSQRPTERPSFAELSNLLWDLEHEGSSYVNFEPLIDEPEAKDDDTDLSNDATQVENPKWVENKEPNGDLGFQNPGFSDENTDEHTTDDTKQILPGKLQKEP